MMAPLVQRRKAVKKCIDRSASVLVWGYGFRKQPFGWSVLAFIITSLVSFLSGWLPQVNPPIGSAWLCKVIPAVSVIILGVAVMRVWRTTRVKVVMVLLSLFSVLSSAQAAPFAYVIELTAALRFEVREDDGPAVGWRLVELGTTALRGGEIKCVADYYSPLRRTRIRQNYRSYGMPWVGYYCTLQISEQWAVGEPHVFHSFNPPTAPPVVYTWQQVRIGTDDWKDSKEHRRVDWTAILGVDNPDKVSYEAILWFRDQDGRQIKWPAVICPPGPSTLITFRTDVLNRVLGDNKVVFATLTSVSFEPKSH